MERGVLGHGEGEAVLLPWLLLVLAREDLRATREGGVCRVRGRVNRVRVGGFHLHRFVNVVLHSGATSVRKVTHMKTQFMAQKGGGCVKR